jgi:hypothetical protein
MSILALVTSAALALTPIRPPNALAALDTAIARMGGAEALGRIQRVRFEMITQWQRTSFDGRPYADQPSYEWHSDLRDYATGSWRNTRRYAATSAAGTAAGAPVWREITDVVRDDVAIRRATTAPNAPAASATWGPLNVAYVDERRELFAVAPERALLGARAARDARALADTSIAGVAHARVSATVDGLPMTLFLRRSDGLLAMTRFRAEQPNDFGLTPWGPMEVELWYSRWAPLPLAGTSGVPYPGQWDLRRVGRPYKRMTVLSATLDAAAPADSFAVSDSLRAAYRATATRPMHDLPLAGAKVVEPRLVAFNTPGAPTGAVRLGRRWVLLEAGQAPLVAERTMAWLGADSLGGAGNVAGAIVTMVAAGNGGVSWLVGQRQPVHVAPGARPFVDAMLRNRGATATSLAPIDRGRWVRVDGDSLWVEPIDLPDMGGSALVYVPSLRWVYAGGAVTAMHVARVVDAVRARGWIVERVGSGRGLVTVLPTP